MFDVMEHLPDLKRFLKKEVFQVLRKRGLFIFQTPNKLINIVWVWIDNKSIFANWWDEHCSLQTYKSLKKLLKKVGFKNIKIEKHNILTDYNINKVRKKTGIIGLFLLKLIAKMPIMAYPNFYGSCKK